MSTGSFIMMSTWMGLVTIMTIYFFYRVLTTKPKTDENDEEKDNEEDLSLKNPK